LHCKALLEDHRENSRAVKEKEALGLKEERGKFLPTTMKKELDRGPNWDELNNFIESNEKEDEIDPI